MTLFTARARARAASSTLARLEGYARTALAQIERHARAGRRVLALVWLDIRTHVAEAQARLARWVREGGAL
jgi:hypothetical protein